MFGSDIFAQFGLARFPEQGLPPFPFQNLDPQGGLFGVNFGADRDLSGTAAPAAGTPATGTAAQPSLSSTAPIASPPAAAGPNKPLAPALGAPSPLAGGGTLTPGAMSLASTGDFGTSSTPEGPPAAGVRSEFGPMQV